MRNFNAIDLLTAAADLIGPASDRDTVHPEYTRAIAELVATMLGREKEDVIAALNVLA